MHRGEIAARYGTMEMERLFHRAETALRRIDMEETDEVLVFEHASNVGSIVFEQMAKVEKILGLCAQYGLVGKSNDLFVHSETANISIDI